MMCVAQYSEDKHWYRAVVTSLTGNQRVHVTYVDYGNSEELSYFCLRKISDEFVRLPIQVRSLPVSLGCMHKQTSTLLAVDGLVCLHVVVCA